jgi:hypothetical protein
MVSAESVLLGKLRDPWCTVLSARVLTIYHAISSRPIVTLGRDHMHIYCKLCNGSRSERVLPLNVRWSIRRARHAKSQYWSSVESILLNRSIESGFILATVA